MKTVHGDKCPECGGAYDDVLTIGTAESHGIAVPKTHTTYRPHKDGCMFGMRPEEVACERGCGKRQHLAIILLFRLPR